MAETIKKSPQGFTYGDYCTWPDEESWELIDGVAYSMTPAPARVHAHISGELCFIFQTYLRNKKCKIYNAPFDVRLPKSDEPDNAVQNVVQPDILVVCDEKKLDDKGCRGAPDLIVEILSPSTASKDCIKKRALYELHGVKEFWTVDPGNRMVTVYLMDADKTFAKARIYADEDKIKVSIFPDLEIDLTQIFPFQPKIVRESPKDYL